MPASCEADDLPDLAAVGTRVDAYLSGAPTEVTAAAKAPPFCRIANPAL
jgi:hypothetical protein